MNGESVHRAAGIFERADMAVTMRKNTARTPAANTSTGGRVRNAMVKLVTILKKVSLRFFKVNPPRYPLYAPNVWCYDARQLNQGNAGVPAWPPRKTRVLGRHNRIQESRSLPPDHAHRNALWSGDLRYPTNKKKPPAGTGGTPTDRHSPR